MKAYLSFSIHIQATNERVRPSTKFGCDRFLSYVNVLGPIRPFYCRIEKCLRNFLKQIYDVSNLNQKFFDNFHSFWESFFLRTE